MILPGLTSGIIGLRGLTRGIIGAPGLTKLMGLYGLTLVSQSVLLVSLVLRAVSLVSL